MDPEGNRLQNSCSPRHWGHSMHGTRPCIEYPQCLGLQLLFVKVYLLGARPAWISVLNIQHDEY